MSIIFFLILLLFHLIAIRPSYTLRWNFDYLLSQYIRPTRAVNRTGPIFLGTRQMAETIQKINNEK